MYPYRVQTFTSCVLAALPGNVMNEWLGPRVNVAVAGVCGIACFVICAFAPVFPLYFASYVLFQGITSFFMCAIVIVIVCLVPVFGNLSHLRHSCALPHSLQSLLCSPLLSASTANATDRLNLTDRLCCTRTQALPLCSSANALLLEAAQCCVSYSLSAAPPRPRCSRAIFSTVSR